MHLFGVQLTAVQSPRTGLRERRATGNRSTAVVSGGKKLSKLSLCLCDARSRFVPCLSYLSPSSTWAFRHFLSPTSFWVTRMTRWVTKLLSFVSSGQKSNRSAFSCVKSGETLNGKHTA
ncbi:unnamed protein product [Ectocarpus sp. 6 AP-2014]